MSCLCPYDNMLPIGPDNLTHTHTHCLLKSNFLPTHTHTQTHGGGLLAWFCQLSCTVCPVLILCAAADCARCLQSLLLAAGGLRSLLCPDASVCLMPGAAYYFSPRCKQHTYEQKEGLGACMAARGYKFHTLAQRRGDRTIVKDLCLAIEESSY